jgi:hypothetical protein
VAKAPIASEILAMAKARASRFLENLIAALVGCLLVSTGGAVILRLLRHMLMPSFLSLQTFQIMNSATGLSGL